MRYRLRTLRSGRWQFTIRTLLFVMLCLGGILAGFQTGYYWGAERRRAEAQFAKVYPVADAIYVDSESQQPDFDTLIAALKSTVDPASWSEVGGPASVQVMAQQPPLIVIAQTGQNHQAINALLSELKALRQKTNATR
jgi:hypothetical protein